MKKYTSFILFAVMGLSLVSCEDVLTKNPLTKFTEDNFWTSETNVELYANYFYNTFAGYGKGASGSTFYFPTLNDNQVGRDFVNWKSTSVDASNGTWNDCYSEIRRANIMLSHLEEVGLSQKSLAKWQGVARLYRGLQHYYLVRSFGDCYWVDKVLVPQDEDILYGPRHDRDQVMDKVLEDINFAVENIPASDSRTEINQAVALAIKSEICLYEGTFCKYRVAADNGKGADAERAKNFLTQCVDASAKIMSNSNYALNGDYQANYNSIDLAGNKEMIMYKQYATGQITHGITDYTTSSTMQLGMSKSAFDAFLFIDGECLANTSCDKNDRAVFTPDPQAEGNWVSDLSAVLAVRDPRLSVDVDPILMYQGTGATPRIGTDGGCMVTTSSSGYGVRKFDNLNVEWIHRNNANSCYTDGPVYWLANIILNHAEASAELGNGATAIADINKLRTRVQMPNITSEAAIKADPANNMGVSNLIWEVRRERRVELMYDNDDRYWSLIRWHQLDKLDTEKYPEIVMGAWIGDHYLATNHPHIVNGYISTADKGSRKYESRQYLRPIPSGQIGYNPQIGQNPGW